MMEVFKSPASKAGVERHSKVGKRVHRCIHLGQRDGQVENQVAVRHNDWQLQ